LTGINDHGLASGTYTDASYNTYAFTYSISIAVWTTLPAILTPDLPGVWPWSADYYYPGINNAGDVIGCSLHASQDPVKRRIGQTRPRAAPTRK